MKAAMGYTCDHCGERIAASAQDPVAMTTRGIYHSNRCLQEAYVAAERVKDATRDEKRKRRSQAAKARWAKRKTSSEVAV